jgi:hypothetical protein
LAQELDNQKCHTTDTVTAGRVGSSKLVRQGAMKKMNIGERNILIMGWKDKSVVLMMSIMTHQKEIVTIQKGGQKRNSKTSVCI